jgi:hypothetical protein
MHVRRVNTSLNWWNSEIHKVAQSMIDLKIINKVEICILSIMTTQIQNSSCLTHSKYLKTMSQEFFI